MPKTKNYYHTPDKELEEMLAVIDELYSHQDTIISSGRTIEAKESMLLSTYSAATHYAFGIRIMMGAKPMAKTSSVLLRCLFEAWVKIEYISLRPDGAYVFAEIMDGLSTSKEQNERLENYFLENEKKQIGNLHLNQVRANLNRIDQDLEFFEKKLYEVEPIPAKQNRRSKLYEKAKLIDSVRTFDKLEHSAYFNYQILYHNLSGSVHLGIDGLSKWTTVDRKSIRFNDGGESLDDAKRILWTAIALLKDISVRVMKELGEYDEDFDMKYQKFIELH